MDKFQVSDGPYFATIGTPVTMDAPIILKAERKLITNCLRLSQQRLLELQEQRLCTHLLYPDHVSSLPRLSYEALFDAPNLAKQELVVSFGVSVAVIFCLITYCSSLLAAQFMAWCYRLRPYVYGKPPVFGPRTRRMQKPLGTIHDRIFEITAGLLWCAKNTHTLFIAYNSCIFSLLMDSILPKLHKVHQSIVNGERQDGRFYR